MKIDTIRELFAHPPTEFGPTPFWFLNDDLDPHRLRSALEEMKAKGIAGVIIHPRTGMEVEYLSDAFWERLRFICDTLKNLGMSGWLYDEYNWPSGPVGGRLLREHPEFRQKGLDYRLVPAQRAEELLQSLPGELLAAFEVTGDGVSDRTEEAESHGGRAFRDGRALIFFVKEVGVSMYATHCAPWTRGETGYLDVLNPDAVDEFMRLTHLEYDRRLKEYYGSPIAGIFTDEPRNYSAIPYTSRVSEMFRDRYGCELRGALPSLAGRLDGIRAEDRIRDRTRYFELVRDLYVESYFGKIAGWASERGLIFTGHLGEEDDVSRLPATNISFHAPLSKMGMPGTDVLCDKHGYDKEHGAMSHPNFNPKALSSTAHHTGAGRALCEIWGGAGWATPPERLKAVLNWAQACGVNFVNPHAAYMSLKGLRKRDFPSSHFLQQPWWRFYDKFSEYIARLSFLNSRGTHAAEVLFAFPMKSLWADFDRLAEGNRFADFMEAASETLLRNQLDFDYLFDEVLEAGAVEIEGRRMKIGDEKYSLLLLPLSPVLPRRLLELAERFVEAGGPVVAFGYEAPTHDEYGEDISERAHALFGGQKDGDVAYQKLGSDSGPDLSRLAAATRERVRADLIAEGSLARDLIYLHRKIEGADFYFVANLSEKEGRVELAFRCKGRPQIWDPERGTTKNALAYESGLEHTRISSWFHPNQALFFVFTDEPPVDHVDSTNLNLTSMTTEHVSGYTSALEVRLSHAGKRYTRSVEQALPPIYLPERWELDYPMRNILLLDQWEIELLSPGEALDWSPKDDPRIGARGRLMISAIRGAFAAGRAARKALGRYRFSTTKYQPLDEMVDAGDRWCKLFGIDTSRLDLYEMPELLLKIAKYAGFGSGYDFPPPGCEYAMSAVFRLDHIPEDLALVYENLEGGPSSIRINDVEVEARAEPTFVWDSSNLALPIAEYVKVGDNSLRLQWKQPSFPSLFPSVHGIEPVCLAGRFWVKNGRIVEQKYRAPAMPWSDIGLPNYIGALTYKSTFEIPTSYMAQQLLLKFDRIGAAAEVKINGRPAGVLLWRPYSLDITDLALRGENAIEVTVANTAANLLGEPAASGIIGRPYIAPYWRHRIRLGD